MSGREPPPRGLEVTTQPVPKASDRRYRDLDSATAAFPIGALRQGRSAVRSDATTGPTARVVASPDDEEQDDDDDDDDDITEEGLGAPRRIMIDARFVALWLVAATALALLAVAAATAAVLFL